MVNCLSKDIYLPVFKAYGAHAAYTLARLEAMQKRDKKALDWVEEALKNGFAHGEVLLMDPVMAGVRGLKGWKALIKKYRVVLPE